MSTASTFLRFEEKWAWVESLKNDGIREGQFIDFKERHLTLETDDAKRDFARHIAGLANSQGGFIVIGVQEREGIAQEIVKVALNEEIPKQYDRAIRKFISPNPSIKFHSLHPEGTPEDGIFVIQVLESPNKPHAVMNGELFRYLIRSGSETRNMSEPEVARLFEGRFSSSDKSEKLLYEYEARLLQSANQEKNWLVLSMYPDFKGALAINNENLELVEAEFRRRNFGGALGTRLSFESVAVGFKKYRLVDMGGLTVDASYECADLYDDGAISVAVELPSENGIRHVEFSDRVQIPDHVFNQETIVVATLAMFKVLERHAKLAGIAGTLNFRLNLQVAQGKTYGVSPYSRNELQAPSTGPNKNSHWPALASFSSEEFFSSRNSRYSVVHALVSQIFQNFNIIECVHISNTGELQTTKWSTYMEPFITALANQSSQSN